MTQATSSRDILGIVGRVVPRLGGGGDITNLSLFWEETAQK